VNVHHLIFTEDDLAQFDVNLKLFPPLRAKSDQDALWAGLLDGTIDYVESGHLPCDAEIKALEFPYAAFGAIGLETIFPLLHTYAKPGFDLDAITKVLCYNQRKMFGQLTSVECGSIADLTLFTPSEQWTFQEENIGSLGRNTPCIGMPFKGKVVGTFSHQQFHKNTH
jgi:dihydroorotase